jgi:hypothetical protein
MPIDVGAMPAKKTPARRVMDATFRARRHAELLFGSKLESSELAAIQEQLYVTVALVRPLGLAPPAQPARGGTSLPSP